LSKFALKEIEEIRFARNPFWVLKINAGEPNEKVLLEESWDKMVKDGREETLDNIQQSIQDKAFGKKVPEPNKYRKLGKINKNDPYECFEFRKNPKNPVRIYGFYVPGTGFVLYDGHVKDKKKQERLLKKLSETLRKYYKEKQTNNL
jgi:hypothetical protein